MVGAAPRYLLASLPASRRQIYIERSNEVWSSATPTGRRNYAAAAALGLYGPQLHAARSVQMFSAWADAFGPQARAQRLLHVLSTQAGGFRWAGRYR